jgi:hypothetical protein
MSLPNEVQVNLGNNRTKTISSVPIAKFDTSATPTGEIYLTDAQKALNSLQQAAIDYNTKAQMLMPLLLSRKGCKLLPSLM